MYRNRGLKKNWRPQRAKKKFNEVACVCWCYLQHTHHQTPVSLTLLLLLFLPVLKNAFLILIRFSDSALLFLFKCSSLVVPSTTSPSSSSYLQGRNIINGCLFLVCCAERSWISPSVHFIHGNSTLRNFFLQVFCGFEKCRLFCFCFLCPLCVCVCVGVKCFLAVFIVIIFPLLSYSTFYIFSYPTLEHNILRLLNSLNFDQMWFLC